MSALDSAPAACSLRSCRRFVAVAEKRARHVLVYRTVQMLGGAMTGSDNASPLLAPLADPPVEPRLPGSRRKLKPFEDIDALLAAHSYSAANWVAMHCQRHMELYGTTKEQLGWLAINSRRNAGLNPRAAFREPMTMDDYLAARPISTPFGLSTATSRSTDPSRWWSRMPTTRRTARIPL